MDTSKELSDKEIALELTKLLEPQTAKVVGIDKRADLLAKAYNSILKTISNGSNSEQ